MGGRHGEPGQYSPRRSTTARSEARSAAAGDVLYRTHGQGGAELHVKMVEAVKRRNKAEGELLTKQREGEAKLTTLYNQHKQQLSRLQFEINSKQQEQAEAVQAMTRWRTQWEEEMTDKNAVAAELLTLRSEFERSSGTYDKEIEGLKDMLERVRLTASELRDNWEETVTQKNTLLGQQQEARERERNAAMSALARLGGGAQTTSAWLSGLDSGWFLRFSFAATMPSETVRAARKRGSWKGTRARVNWG